MASYCLSMQVLRPPTVFMPLIIALALAPFLAAHAQTIFKCRDPQGGWAYSAYPSSTCRGPITLLKSAPEDPPAIHGPIAQRKPLTRQETSKQKRLLQAHLKHLRKTRRALEATPIPQDPHQAQLRSEALTILSKRIERTQHKMGLFR